MNTTNTTCCPKCGYSAPRIPVPKLTPADLHPVALAEPIDGRLSLQGWRRRVFGLLAGHPGAELAQAVNDALAALCGRASIDVSSRRPDAHEIWNAAMNGTPDVVIIPRDSWEKTLLERREIA